MLLVGEVLIEESDDRVRPQVWRGSAFWGICDVAFPDIQVLCIYQLVP